MKRLLYPLVLLVAVCASCTSSIEEPDPEPVEPPQPVDRTVIMFYPYSDLMSYFAQNITDFASVFASHQSSGERIVVCIESTPDDVNVIELVPQGAMCVKDTVDRFSNPQFATTEGIRDMLLRVVALAPASTYSMIIGGHGMGWLPASTATRSAHLKARREIPVDALLTRYFGGLSAPYIIDISTLAEGIEEAGLKMEYMLFDDCYMSSVEVAYELRGVTDRLIACPTEVMAYGFPYHKCGEYLLGEPDYEKVCDEFYNFYISYPSPYGTIAVTDCRKLDALAEAVRQVNLTCGEEIVTGDVQTMDGYSPTIFYDMEDVVRHQCATTSDEDLWTQFEAALAEAVPYKRHTPKYYSMRRGPHEIRTYGGITTSLTSANQLTSELSDTEWYRATH